MSFCWVRGSWVCVCATALSPSIWLQICFGFVRVVGFVCCFGLWLGMFLLCFL